jgi:hypothetical protein
VSNIVTFILIALHCIHVMGYQGHIIIPTTSEQAHTVIEQIQQTFVEEYGGFSRYAGTGGWDGQHGVMTESHCRLVVDTPADRKHDLLALLEEQAEYVKAVLDEEAVYISVQETEVQFV